MTIPRDDADTSSGADLTRLSAAAERPRQQIGPYRLLQLIGEGGMGEVWLAEQVTPVHRQVAIKVIKPGMDTAKVVRRFEAERQALAMMSHPAIAQVFDGGATPEGRPFFAMEYVPGEPITSYCARRRLSIAPRIDLFLEVCDGVQHAHQKGIIHRDLKPSNILVTERDGRRLPKIIDFGVAKATTQSLTERTLYTEFGSLIGTPEYMSPEQADMSGLDVDTRTDVYALGVVLYELLTGVRPFDSEDLRTKSVEEIRRTIRDVDPPRPSTRLASFTQQTSQHPSQTTAPGTATELRGDLDWIIMQALEKDRTRRYGSASDLAADLRRHLADLPVLASPPSTTYRITKFARRHRGGVSVAVGTLLLLVVFATAMAVQARRIAQERDRANREATTAKQVSSFLVGLFEVARPNEATANSVTAREILDRGALRIQQELRSEPEIQSTLLTTMGDAYYSLGSHKKAELLFQQTVALQRQTFGDVSQPVAETLVRQSETATQQGRYEDAVQASRQAIDILGRLPSANDVTRGRALTAFAFALLRQGKTPEAEEAARDGRAVLARLPTGADGELASNANVRGAIFMARADWSNAESAFLEAVEASRRSKGPNHPRSMLYAANLASAWSQQRSYAKAEMTYREIVARTREQMGSEHPQLATFLNNLGAVLFLQRKFGESETSYREALAINLKTFGRKHPNVSTNLENIAETLRREGKHDDAEQALREALAINREVLNPDNPKIGTTLMFLASALCASNKTNEAEHVAREALLINSRLGKDHPRTIESEGALGCALMKQRRFAEAEPLLLRYVAFLQAKDPEDFDIPETIQLVVELYEGWRKPEKAAEWRARR